MARICRRESLLINGQRTCVGCPFNQVNAEEGNGVACYLGERTQLLTKSELKDFGIEEELRDSQFYETSSILPLNDYYIQQESNNNIKRPGWMFTVNEYGRKINEYDNRLPYVVISQDEFGEVSVIIHTTTMDNDECKKIVLQNKIFMTPTELHLRKRKLSSPASIRLANSTEWNKENSFENCIQDACTECECPNDREIVQAEFDKIMKNYLINFIIRKEIKIRNSTLNELLEYNFSLTSKEFDNFKGFEEWIINSIEKYKNR